jgi:hypothetical protein
MLQANKVLQNAEVLQAGVDRYGGAWQQDSIENTGLVNKRSNICLNIVEGENGVFAERFLDADADFIMRGAR